MFEIHVDEHADKHNVQRIVTPLQYSGSHDHVVVRLRS